ncbi:MAG: hypothetical protein HDT23_08375 [Ruminococcus sp.]|nr:hypothetical protein [Ruminococcus sp.]
MSEKNPIIRRTDFKKNQDSELVERIEKYRRKYHITFINAVRQLCRKSLELDENPTARYL